MKKIGKLLTASTLLLVNFCTPVCAEEMIAEEPNPGFNDIWKISAPDMSTALNANDGGYYIW